MKKHFEMCIMLPRQCSFHDLGCTFTGTFDQIQQHVLDKDVQKHHNKMLMNVEEQEQKQQAQKEQEQKMKKLKASECIIGACGIFKDKSNDWYAGIIIERNDSTFTVHFFGWASSFDEVIGVHANKRYEILNYIKNEGRKQQYLLVETAEQGQKIFKKKLW
jgi:hypothetical protein